MPDQRISFRKAFFSPAAIKRGVKTGLLVGTILIVINQGGAISDGQWPAWWTIVLTYFVPYFVSSHATAASITEAAKTQRP